jgi:hypothetical protein
MKNPDHISGSLETNFLGKMLKLFDADPGSRIWDGKNSDAGSGMEKHPGSAPLLTLITKFLVSNLH